ncbi:MAG TPA: M28 family peptidase [Candidatus Kapabacteria bacterium]|nr:M28 family peptidase [Candidatus Kapabacteria bacterium]
MLKHSRTLPGRVLTLTLLLGIPALLSAQSPGRLQPDSLLASRLRDHVRYLASDELAGRRTGEAGCAAAASYIAQKFQNAGLVAVPGCDGYFYHYDYLAGVTLGERNWLAIRSPNGKEVRLAPGDRYNPFGFSDDGGADDDLVFAGYGITAKDENYDDYAGLDVRGRIVVVMRYSPDGTNPHGALARFATYASKVRTAHEHGAAALVIINPPLDPPVLLPVALDRNYTYAGLPTVFAFSTLFDDVRDPAGRTLAKVQQLTDSLRRPITFPMRGWKASVKVHVQMRHVNVADVIGMVPGNDPALRDQIIVIGGHYDHLGMGGEGSLDGGHEPAVHHGADDNASGSAGVMELARFFAAQHSNRRTLVFMCFSGEEEGLLGSAAFVGKPPFPLERVSTMVNMDMIGRLDTAKSLIVQGVGTSPWWKPMLDSNNAGHFILKMVEDGFGPSDHSSFYAKGIPVLFYFTGLHSDYHRPTDTWEKINYGGEADVLAGVAGMVQRIDAHTERPPFMKTQSSTRTSGGFKVYVGTIPDYAYEGKGLRLSGVSEGGPAQKGGLKEGDIIVRFGARQINNVYDYTDALGDARPKDRVEIEILRGEEKKTVTVELGSR